MFRAIILPIFKNLVHLYKDILTVPDFLIKNLNLFLVKKRDLFFVE